MSLSPEIIDEVRREWAHDLPTGWRFVRFGDALSLQRRPIEILDAKEYIQPVIRRGHGGIEIRDKQIGANIKTKVQFILHAGDWLMSKVQILHRAYGIVPPELDGAIASGSYYSFEIKSNLDPKFLWYLSHTDVFHKSCSLASVGVVIEKMVFRATDWLDFEFPLPPLPEQRRIAEILSSVDEAIAATRAVIEQTRKVKQAVLERLLTKGIGHTRFKQTEIGEIPEGWEVVQLQHVASIRTGLAKNKKEVPNAIELPYLRVANVQDGYVDLSDIQNIRVSENQVERYRLKKGDVLMTEGGDYDKLGRGDVWNGAIDPCLHQNHVFAVRTDREKLLPEFLALLTASSGGKAYFQSCSKQTTNLASINSTQVKEFPTRLPTLDEQREIVSLIDTAQSPVTASEEAYRRLLALKSALMSDLLTGRKRVSDPLTLAAE